MIDKRYVYPIIAASKVIITKENKILLTREPQDNSWMPGRLGLPGGKFLINESILDGTKRKIKEETGLDYKLKGLFEVINILMPERTVYHFIFAADYLSEEKNLQKLYSTELGWYSQEQINKLTKDDLTEYYLKETLESFFNNPEKIIELEKIKTLYSFKDKQIQEWMSKGTVK